MAAVGRSRGGPRRSLSFRAEHGAGAGQWLDCKAAIAANSVDWQQPWCIKPDKSFVRLALDSDARFAEKATEFRDTFEACGRS